MSKMESKTEGKTDDGSSGGRLSDGHINISSETEDKRIYLTNSYWLVRVLFIRSLGIIYCKFIKTIMIIDQRFVAKNLN